jgi:hypothetical protein
MLTGIIYEQGRASMTTTKPKKPLAITPRYDEILQAIHECRYVRVSDITRLFYSPSSKTHVNEILNALSGGKDYQAGQYLYRFPLPSTTTGEKTRIYTLGGKGIKHLQEEDGIEVAWRFDASKIPSFSYNYLQHQLDITSFLIAAKLFSRDNEAAGRDPLLQEYKTEYVLRPLREKVTIEVTTGPNGQTEEETVPVVPDLWLDFHFPNAKINHAPILIEIDRGTEGVKKFKQKIKALLAFVSGPGYKRMFGVRAVKICFAISAGHPNRLDECTTWTSEVLKEQKMQNYADTFRFCRLRLSWETEHLRLFNDPLWFRPEAKKPLPLLS